MIVVLPGVHEDLVVLATQRRAQRRGLDKLWPSSQNGQEPHSRA